LPVDKKYGVSPNCKTPIKGENIEYICVDLKHQNPLQRVVAAKRLKDKNSVLDYDKEMLHGAAETVLGAFGFERTLSGKPKDKKWWEELGKYRMNDFKAERSNTIE